MVSNLPNGNQQSAAWQALAELQKTQASIPLSQRFADDKDRAKRFSQELGPLFIDFSKQHLSEEIMRTLQALASAQGLSEKLTAMHQNEAANNTEGRSANYRSLRGWAGEAPCDDPAIDAMYRHMEQLAEGLRSGETKSATGTSFTHIVNIGIGGSDFGPRLFTEALQEHRKSAFSVHFLANIDPSCAAQLLATLPPESTLFIIASKSFGTQETLANAAAARDWLQQALPGKEIHDHFIAVTSKPASAAALGVPQERILSVPEWVGGRFSVWSGFGLAVAANYGWATFCDILRGGFEVDEHVANSPMDANIPATLALLDVWYRDYWGFSSQTVLPYCHRLKELPDYLQQLFMESAGKSVDREGRDIQRPSGGVIWGSEGTNGQHSFHQLLHQGSDVIPCDFIAVLQAEQPLAEQQQALLANCFAQSLALMNGKSAAAIEQELIAAGEAPNTAAELARHKAMPGNRPSTTILIDSLTPRALGALVALYEYRLICASFLWNINPFDQWGVELGKEISRQLLGALNGESGGELDSSTEQLLARARRALK